MSDRLRRLYSEAKSATAFHAVATLTVARLHALRVAVLLRVPGDGSHVGHVVALRVGVGRVRRVARHVRGGRVILWRGESEELRFIALVDD